MKTKIDALIILIERLCGFKIAGKQTEAGKLLREVTVLMMEIFPDMIMVYEKPEFEEVKDDAEYWVNQLGRITEAIDSGDDFRLIDVLHFETAENLKIFADMVRE